MSAADTRARSARKADVEPLKGAAQTAFQQCLRDELERYFALLDGEPPADLHRMIVQQVETTLFDSVLRECGGNRTRAAEWLGISRGTLRNKLAELDSD